MFRFLPSVQTDDKGVFATTLSEEYVHAALAFSLTEQELHKLALSSVDVIFAGDDIKAALRQELEKFAATNPMLSRI